MEPIRKIFHRPHSLLIIRQLFIVVHCIFQVFAAKSVAPKGYLPENLANVKTVDARIEDII
jgi:hypothetical protein